MEREDYFFGEAGGRDKKKVYALVIYDIIENKKRVKFAKFMCGYGTRVQKSAFEVSLEERKYERMLREIPGFCDEEDSIRVYRIEGRNLVHKWGVDIETEIEDVIVL